MIRETKSRILVSHPDILRIQLRRLARQPVRNRKGFKSRTAPSDADFVGLQLNSLMPGAHQERIGTFIVLETESVTQLVCGRAGAVGHNRGRGIV